MTTQLLTTPSAADASALAAAIGPDSPDYDNARASFNLAVDQGGGLIRAILADPGAGFTARAITRNPASDAAMALAAKGVDVVQADLDDEASLTRAFEDAHGIFCVTNFWEHFSPEREKAQARNLANAVAAADPAHVIWSTLEDVRDYVPLNDSRMPTLMGGYKVPHFDAKAEANAFFREAGVPVTYLTPRSTGTT